MKRNDGVQFAFRRGVLAGLSLAILLTLHVGSAYAVEAAPTPLLKKDEQVDWWFVFKFNSASFPGCGGSAERACIFGGEVQKKYGTGFSQQFVYASSQNRALQRGAGCAGDSINDPLGATFDQIYANDYYYVVWNDQFYDDPEIKGCTKSCSSPWGHSKGMVAWNENGEGIVLQVTTPSWPAAASKKHPRQSDGNTLGCIANNNVKFSQHFFSLKLTKEDLIKVLKGIGNASIVTNNNDRQIVNNGGPADIQRLVQELGTKSTGRRATKERLSSGVVLISKPSQLRVPPWQMVSALLDRVPLRTATWWANPKIYTTTATSSIGCWDRTLDKAGAIEIATTGQWGGKEFGLTGGPSPNNNHAKLGVSTSGTHHYAIFGDLNQQGTLSGQNCASSQNGRGGLFYVIEDKVLADNIRDLIKGRTAPTRAPAR